ncbi:hypothetical protein F5878DRAFT_64385 [Lentinula raphanica]|uniref:DUF6533 domain-containing protein n=1 Tax=Lentinula raphanica TaxID=153919 RepID=A0AA38PL81_9AGAR|nr:hypothetical protein F5878DRAFT_64385 [Lentinula raphanica]
MQALASLCKLNFLLRVIIGLLATGCDYALTRRKEKNYAWNREKPLRITFVKILFVLARYLAFVIHIVNIVLSSIWTVKFQDNIKL